MQWRNFHQQLIKIDFPHAIFKIIHSNMYIELRDMLLDERRRSSCTVVPQSLRDHHNAETTDDYLLVPPLLVQLDNNYAFVVVVKSDIVLHMSQYCSR